jgi:GH24 family phage-related lysozyme (muramidase)
MLNPASRKLTEKVLSTISNYQKIQANREPSYVEQTAAEVKASNNEDLAIERDRLLEATKGGAPPVSDQAAYAQYIRDRDRIKAIGDELYKRNNKKRPSSNELQAATLDTLKNPSSGLVKTATHEDFSAKPYKDGDGYSIGHGFHLDKESITKADLQGSGISDVVKKALLAGDHTNKNLKLTKPQSEKIFQNIYNRRRRETARTYPWVQDLPDEAKNVVYDMAFNLGRTKFKKFKGMLEALEQGDYKKAALHVKFVDGPNRGKLTPYWGQTKSRAEDNFDILMRL